MMSAVATFGTINSRERKPQFFTSLTYPFDFEDSINGGGVTLTRGNYFRHPDDTFSAKHPHLVGGELIETIRYKKFTAEDAFDAWHPHLLGGSLTEVIRYVTTNSDEQFQSVNPTLMSGSLITVINRVEYATQSENFASQTPTLQSGALL